MWANWWIPHATEVRRRTPPCPLPSSFSRRRTPQLTHPCEGTKTDYSLRRIWKLLCQPPCFVIDFRPFIPPVIVVADPSIAEEISRSSPAFPHALRKDRSLSRFRWILGKGSIVLADVGVITVI
jgi:hypothetical protein